MSPENEKSTESSRERAERKYDRKKRKASMNQMLDSQVERLIEAAQREQVTTEMITLLGQSYTV